MLSEFPLPSSHLRYPVSWPYLERSHVFVLKDGIPWPFSWVSGTEIDVDGGPDGILPGRKLTIMRATPDLESYAQIADATLLDADQLNRVRRQLLYLLQERSGGVGGYISGAINVITSDIDRVNSALDDIERILAELMRGLLTLDDLNAAIVVATNEALAAKKAILDEIAKNVPEFEALRNRALGLEQNAVALGARIVTETLIRSNADQALAQSITETQAAIVNGDGDTLTAAVTQANLAIANAGNALASSIESVRATLEDADEALAARIDTERIAWVHGDEALAVQISTVNSRVTTERGELEASITQVDQARINGDGILAERITSLEAIGPGSGYNDSELRALINQTNTARIEGDRVLTNSLTTLQSAVGTQGNTIAQVSDQQSTLATRTGIVEAQRVIKTAVRQDGREVFAGIGLAATINNVTGITQSEVILMADRFLLTPPGDPSGPATPILAAGTVDGIPTTVFPAAKYGDQSIGARVLVDGSIETRHMKVLGGRGAALNLDPTTADTSAWRTIFGTRNAVALADGASGSYALRLTGITHVEEIATFALLPGRQYKVAFWARKPAGTGNAFVRVITTNSAGGQTGYLVLGHVPTSMYLEFFSIPTGWTRYEGFFTADAMTVRGTLDIHANYLSGGYDGGGYTEFQALRVEELIDSALIVQGGIKADRIDTEGLTLKRNGVVIFGGGVNLDWSNIVANNSWLNSNVTLNANGTLAGGGGGQVTLPGMGLRTFRVVAQGYSAGYTAPAGPGLYDSDTGSIILAAVPMYSAAKIKRSNGAVIAVGNWNTLAGGSQPNDMATALNAVGNDHIIVIWTYDEPQGNRLAGGLAEAMYRHGASKAIFGSPNFQSRGAYVLVAIGGCGEGNGFESYSGTSASDPNAWCDVAFSIRNGQLIVSGAAKTPSTISDYGYVGDMNATLGAAWNANISGQPSDVSISNAQIGINSSGQFYGGGAGTGVVVSNGQLSLGADGRLYSAGSQLAGQVTIGGLGYSGAMNATNGATFGVNVWGQITAGNISTYIAGAAIGIAHINTATITNLAALSAYMGMVQIAAGGGLFSGKSSWTDDTPGLYQGWDGGEPCVYWGNANAHLKYKPSLGLIVKMDTFYGTCSPTSVDEYATSPSLAVTPITANPAGGTPPFTYAWSVEQQSGPATIFLAGTSGPRGATAGFGARGIPDQTVTTAIVRCVVVDSNGRTAISRADIRVIRGTAS